MLYYLNLHIFSNSFLMSSSIIMSVPNLRRNFFLIANKFFKKLLKERCSLICCYLSHGVASSLRNSVTHDSIFDIILLQISYRQMTKISRYIWSNNCFYIIKLQIVLHQVLKEEITILCSLGNLFYLFSLVVDLPLEIFGLCNCSNFVLEILPLL